MKKISIAIIFINIIFSIYLVIAKMIQDASCKTCSNLSVSDKQLAIMALVGSLAIALLYYLSVKYRPFNYIYLVFTGITAFVSSGLMALQLAGKNNICWPCLISEVLFYLIFMVLVIERLSPWLRQKWYSQ